MSLVWTARAGEESTRAETKFLVRYDLPARSVEAAGLVERDTFEVVSPGAAVLRGGGVTRDLSIGPLPVVALSGKLGDLIRYPYGCLEQTVSTAFPLVYLSDLARAVDPKAFEHGDPAVMVQSAIRRLATMQQPSGGFSMWPNGDTTAPWPSLYAAHFLVEARQAGFLVDSFLYDRAVVFAANEARIRASMGDGERLGAAYALYVLARAGKADAGSMDALRERHLPTLKPEARAALAAAYAASGNAKGAADLLRGLDDVDAGPRATGGTFDSTVRNRALLLLALIETAPGDPRVARLAGRLGREAGADPWTTQESGFAFVALGRLARRQSAAGPYGGTVVVGGRPLGTFGGETKTFRDLPAGSVTIRMNPGSPAGAAFYSLTERGVPTDAAFKPEASGLEIERAWLDRKGGAVDLSSVAQGDLLVLRTRVRSTQGPVANVAVVNLLPGALEVENPRLKGSETLSWVSDASDPAYLEARDDRVVCFVDLGDGWTTTYALVRAVHAGTFRVPPASAEAMYDPARRAVTERGSLVVTERR